MIIYIYYMAEERTIVYIYYIYIYVYIHIFFCFPIVLQIGAWIASSQRGARASTTSEHALQCENTLQVQVVRAQSRNRTLAHPESQPPTPQDEEDGDDDENRQIDDGRSDTTTTPTAPPKALAQAGRGRNLEGEQVLGTLVGTRGRQGGGMHAGRHGVFGDASSKAGGVHAGEGTGARYPMGTSRSGWQGTGRRNVGGVILTRTVLQNREESGR